MSGRDRSRIHTQTACGQLRGDAVARNEPGASERSTVKGKVLEADEDGNALSYTLSLVEAYW